MSIERQIYTVPSVRCPLLDFKPSFVADCKECPHHLGMKVTSESRVIKCGLED